MRLLSWLRPLAERLNRTRARRAPHRSPFRPRVEGLEDRLVPTSHFTEFPVPTLNSTPDGITRDRDGNVWFTEFNDTVNATGGGKIGRITLDGQITEFDTPLPHPRAIVAGPDGNLWFTEGNFPTGVTPAAGEVSTFGVMSRAGVVLQEFTLSGVADPGLAFGPDGSLWVSEYWNNEVIRMGQDGQITRYATPFPTGSFGAGDIAVAPDGTVWFDSAVRTGSTAWLGQITPQGAVAAFSYPQGQDLLHQGAMFRGLVIGPDGNVWAGGRGEGFIDKISPSGQLLAMYLAGNEPRPGVFGPDGNLWFVDAATDKIGGLLPDRTFPGYLELSPPSANSGLTGITAGPGNTLWFTEENANRVGKFDVGQPPTPSLVLRNAVGNVTNTFNEGDTVSFDASGTTDPDGDGIRSYQWDLDGDGVFETTGSQVAHVFHDKGVYYVTLRVTDEIGLPSTTTAELTVNQPPPLLRFIAPGNYGTNYLTITPGTAVNLAADVTNRNFHDDSSADVYSWTVTKNGLPYASGNGGGLFSFAPDAPATYVAMVTLTNPYGSATASQSIAVAFPRPLSFVQLARTTQSFVSGPDHLTPVGTALYFQADDGNGPQLWRTNGRPGDAALVDTGSQPFDASQLVTVGSWLYFITYDSGNNAYSLWRNNSADSPSNGASTSQLIATMDAAFDGEGPYGLTALGDDLYFGAAASSATDAPWHLWRVAEANMAGGNVPTAAPFLFPGSDVNGPYLIKATGSYLYFTADAPNTTNIVLWRSDGTLDGTVPIGDGAIGYIPGHGLNQAAAGTDLYQIVDGTLWRISGAATTAEQVPTAGSPYLMTGIGDTLYFATDGGAGYTLWKYPGSDPSGPSVVWQAANPTYLLLQIVGFGQDVYFLDGSRNDLLDGPPHLWKSDGTVPGTQLIWQPVLFSGGPYHPEALPFALTVAGSDLYFEGLWGEVWQTKGSPETTQLAVVSGSLPSLINSSYYWGPLTGWDTNHQYYMFGWDFNSIVATYSPFMAVGSTLYFSVGSQLFRLNNSPIPNADAYTADPDTPLRISAAAGVLANDSDLDTNDVPYLTASVLSLPSHGSLALNPDGSFTYTPVAGYVGPDSFTYQASDGIDASNIATVALTVRNMPPTANLSGPSAAVPGEPLSFVGTFTDPGTQGTFTFNWHVVSTNGQVIADGTGQNFGFIPADVGTYTVTFTVTDNYGGTGAAQQVVTVSTVLPRGNGLFVGGTSGNDTFVFRRAGAGTMTVLRNGVSLGDFTVAGTIRAFGGDGDDTFTVHDALPGGLVLDGQNGSDRYTINYGTLDGPVTITDSGTAGSDALTVNGTGDSERIVKTTDAGTGIIHVARQLPVAEDVDAAGVEATTIHGRGGKDLITDPGSATAIFGDEGDDTIVITATSGSGVVLDGGDGSDTYLIYAGSLAGPVTITDSGTTGTDSVTVNGTAGSDTISQSGNQIVVDGGIIVLVGGVDALAVNGGGGSDQFTVQGTPTVTATVVGVSDAMVWGTAGDDHIVINPGASPGQVTAHVNGVLVGTFTPTGRVVVYGLAGDDDIQVAGGITLPAWLYGGDGNDRLKGGGGNNVLLGEAGDDLLVGGNDRDILIGGTGADRLVGNAEEDILLAGRTAFDADEAALCAVLAEWTSARSYAARVANLTGTDTGSDFANRRNGAYFLLVTVQAATTTVFDDGAADLLTGSSAQDWFFANLAGGGVLDKITDLSAAEFATDLSFILGP